MKYIKIFINLHVAIFIDLLLNLRILLIDLAHFSLIIDLCWDHIALHLQVTNLIVLDSNISLEIMHLQLSEILSLDHRLVVD